MTDSQLQQRIRQLCRPLETVATETTERLAVLSDVRAVVFDIYGTLVISGSGDIGAAAAAPKPLAFEQACRSSGLELTISGAEGVDRLHEMIRQHQEMQRNTQNPYPEVEIRDVWRNVVQNNIGADCASMSTEQIDRLAVEYELRANPCWPMPHAVDVLQALRDQRIPLGLISNAQFFTPLLCESLFGSSLSELGFDVGLRVYSFEHLAAKPGELLYDLMSQRLRQRGIEPSQVLYVGNDMLNDIVPARAVGFRTALFAGDRRSLRWRTDDHRVQGVEPDLILTDLAQILPCVIVSRT